MCLLGFTLLAFSWTLSFVSHSNSVSYFLNYTLIFRRVFGDAGGKNSQSGKKERDSGLQCVVGPIGLLPLHMMGRAGQCINKLNNYLEISGGDCGHSFFFENRNVLKKNKEGRYNERSEKGE